MEYQSLHSYLEARFSGKETVTKQMIIDAKKAYRSQYLSVYYKIYSEDKRQISFRVSKQQYSVLKIKAESNGMKVGTYVKTLVLAGKKVQDDTAIQYLVLRAIDSIEEAIHEDEVLDSKKLLLLLEKIQSLLQ